MCHNEFMKEQETGKGNKVVRNFSIQLAIAFPLIWFLLLSIQALREGGTSIYLAMGWLSIPCALLIATDALIRYSKIDFDNRTVLIHDGIGNKVLITPGSLVKVSAWKGVYNLTFLEKNGTERTLRWQFINYSSRKRDEVLNALYVFNPQAHRA